MIEQYYQETKLNGLVDKQNIAGFSSNYLLTMIHKINKEGFFRFDVNQKCILGFKKKIPTSEFQIVEIELSGASSQAEQPKDITQFYVFFIIDDQQ